MQSTPSADLDPWVASSLLQKAVRRSDTDHAVRAALRLHEQRGSRIWRRLLVIAFEDVGIGDLDLVCDITLSGIDRNVRRLHGTDREVVEQLTRRLCNAPKDRGADYLICAAKQHPDYEPMREAIAGATISQQIGLALDPEQQPIYRAISLWYGGGINGGGPPTVGLGSLPQVMHEFDRLGLPHPVSSCIETAARKTREPMVIMPALLWALSVETRSTPRLETEVVPPSPLVRGVPCYTFDKHTRIGKQAIARLLCENSDVDRVVSRHVPDFRARDVAAMAAFYADAAPVARRLAWAHSHSLEALGLETDMRKVGCPAAGIQPICDVVTANLDHLNDIRTRLFGGTSTGERTK